MILGIIKFEFLPNLKHSCDLMVVWLQMAETDAPICFRWWMDGSSWPNNLWNSFKQDLPCEQLQLNSVGKWCCSHVLVLAKAWQRLVEDELMDSNTSSFEIFRKIPSEENESFEENGFWSGLVKVARASADWKGILYSLFKVTKHD